MSIYLGLGGNLPHPRLGAPRQTILAALKALEVAGIAVRRISPWYRTAPMPASDQPWYQNAVAEVTTALPADRLLAELHRVEEAFGRVRSVPNAPRLIDLDLLDYRGEVAAGGPGKATLPHPRMKDRAFVLRPLADLAPAWRHPATGQGIGELIAARPKDQVIERIDD